MTAIRLLGLLSLLLLGGCLEATDAITGNLRARVDYCIIPPDTVALCPEKPPRQTIFPRRTGARIATAGPAK